MVNAASGASPVLIIPGTGGNRLEAKLSSRENTAHFYCSKNADWYDLWLDVKQLVPGAIDCWCENIQLNYDSSTSTFSNQQGVETRVPCYGDVCGIEYLDMSVKAGDSAYFHAMIEAFADKGYVRGETIVSAPYDFRYSAVSNKDNYVNATMALAEQLYEQTGEKVLWISHSMGGLWSHYILSNADQAWKDKYIEAWVPIAPAYGGTAQEMRLFASGDSEGIPLVSGKTVRNEQRSYESNFWLLPNLELWDSDETIITKGDQTWTAHDLPQFFEDISYADGAQIYKTLPYDLKDPNIKTYVKYGAGKDTPTSYVYGKDWDTIDKTVNGDGDGTVNIRSLEAGIAKGWKNTEHEKFDGEDHQSVLKNDSLLKELLELAGV
ncbi:hypothetical protein TL16_g06070 [Triparma laevis f. inornata]|uniref:Lecithin:cholesterol acyltransferase n=1 Tax=Triparma laevis f. inornata TaxID=1714386 RepID=A0A9W7EE27_9STRA|nr:hypothetical protein TL16_g06070 [Triparma laevis f. inornata]